MSLLHVQNERSTLLLDCAFMDDDDQPVVPSAATYRLDDRGSGTVILAETVFPSLASTVELEITATQNRILGSGDYEHRRVTVAFEYGSPTRHGTAEYVYKVKNLRGAPLASPA